MSAQPLTGAKALRRLRPWAWKSSASTWGSIPRRKACPRNQQLGSSIAATCNLNPASRCSSVRLRNITACPGTTRKCIEDDNNTLSRESALTTVDMQARHNSVGQIETVRLALAESKRLVRPQFPNNEHPYILRLFRSHQGHGSDLMAEGPELAMPDSAHRGGPSQHQTESRIRVLGWPDYASGCRRPGPSACGPLVGETAELVADKRASAVLTAGRDKEA